jgi:hypothetical protein
MALSNRFLLRADYSIASQRRHIPRPDMVRLCTYHSSRGIEGHRVVLFGFETLSNFANSVSAEDYKLGYIVLSRASLELVIPYRASVRNQPMKFLDAAIRCLRRDRSMEAPSKMPLVTAAASATCAPARAIGNNTPREVEVGVATEFVTPRATAGQPFSSAGQDEGPPANPRPRASVSTLDATPRPGKALPRTLPQPPRQPDRPVPGKPANEEPASPTPLGVLAGRPPVRPSGPPNPRLV